MELSYIDPQAALKGTKLLLQVTKAIINQINDDNWPSLDTELGLTLEAVSDSDLSIDDLVAIHLLQGIQTAGQKNNTWAAAHLELIKIRQKHWHKSASGKPDRLKTIIINGPRDCQNTRPGCRLPTAADSSPFSLFVRPAVNYFGPKMQELPWLSAALRRLRRPTA